MVNNAFRGSVAASGGVVPEPAPVPVVETFQSNTGVGSAVACTKPTGVVVDDILLIFAGSDYGGVINDFPTSMSGWNYVTRRGDNIMDAHMGVYWRKADGTEGATQTLNKTNSTNWFSHYIRISGAHLTVPVHAVATRQPSLPEASNALPNITTTADNCLLIGGLSFDGGDGGPYAATGGYTVGDEAEIGTGVGSGGCWVEKDHATPGVTSAGSIVAVRADGAVIFQLAIQPPD